LTLERGLAIGCVLLLGGVALSINAVQGWASTGYGSLDPRDAMRTAIPSVSLMLIGVEFMVASFFLGMLRFEHRPTSGESRAVRSPVYGTNEIPRAG
jgi:hypothetical protein